MNSFIKQYIISTAVLLVPCLTFAAGDSFRTIVNKLVGFINQLVALLVAASLLVFFYGLMKFISKAGDTGEHAKGRQLMTWGIVVFFVMSSVWGILFFLKSLIFG